MTQDTIQLGSKVRSFDFAEGGYGRDLTGERAAYVEGEVVGFAEVEGCERYAILVEKRVWCGEVSTKAEAKVVYPPKNGTPTLMGRTTNFVELV